MKKDKLTIEYDAEKLTALRQYTPKKEVLIEQELTDTLDRLYEKCIPAAVREYIENRPEANQQNRPRAPRRRPESENSGA
ncbi:DUF6103 family protein, partial [Oscillospiraceae bacterium OttesenSCG-928-G22]|nr:DUF6103 family protein [Oscillospiraceae bacterium OttesenSCG-928-G22]